MWARVIEFMLACWLGISPFVFRHADDATSLWATDFISAIFIAVFSLGSFHRKLLRLHLVNIAIALWLIGYGFFAAEPPPPAGLQNYVVVGLLLAMFAIIPSWSARPRRKWREFIASLENQ